MGPSWVILGHLGAILGLSWAILGDFGPILARPGAILGGFGASCGPLGPFSDPLGLSCGPLGTSWGSSWGYLGSSWAILGSSWGYLGPSWAILTPSWPVLGLVWGHLRYSKIAFSQETNADNGKIAMVTRCYYEAVSSRGHLKLARAIFGSALLDSHVRALKIATLNALPVPMLRQVYLQGSYGLQNGVFAADILQKWPLGLILRAAWTS